MTPAATLPAALRFWSRATPGAVALRDGDDAWTYRELAEMADGLAGRMQSAGAVPGDRIALLGENRAEWVLAFLGALVAGTVVVPLNTRLPPRELTRQLEVAGPRLLLSSAMHLATATAATEGPVLAIDRDAPGSVLSLPAMAGRPAEPGPDAPALVSFTSGTTGMPKGAVISHGALAASAAVYARLMGTDDETRTLVIVPLFHNTGFVDQLAHMLVVGGSVDLLREFHVRPAIDALVRRPASYLIGVPSIFRLMMLEPDAGDAFAGCRILAYGGSPMPPGWIRELHARWPALRPYNIYGLTEFTSLSHALEPADAIERAETVGRPVEGVRQQIVDGEVWLAGPTRMLGYLANPAATADVFRGDWLRTGDLGAIDADGFLTLHGRAAEVIVRGGEKIHASQVEGELGALAGVAEAAVVGIPDDVLQERVAACVVPRPGHDFDPEQARAELRDRIADYAVPERILVVDEIPRNANGKIDRALVRSALLAGTAR
jgi:acyl-CoA synthetase (AMP-forming)/AMP-acid ligase II